jgi:hypothetical protein
MNIFEEILWPQFVKIERISKLPLTEQVAAYQQYIYDLDVARQSWLAYQNKGPFAFDEEIFYLLQEDGGFLFQEDGSNLIIE